MAKRSDELLLSLPETKELADKRVSVELAALLREAHSLKGMETRLKEVKARIVELAQGMPGARVGGLCAIVSWTGGGRKLDRALLVENGVQPEVIEASMRETNGHWTCELPAVEGNG